MRLFGLKRVLLHNFPLGFLFLHFLQHKFLVKWKLGVFTSIGSSVNMAELRKLTFQTLLDRAEAAWERSVFIWISIIFIASLIKFV